MKIISLKQPDAIGHSLKRILVQGIKMVQPWLLFGVLILLLRQGQRWISLTDPTAGLPLNLTWLFILQGLLAFMIVLFVCWWLLQEFWTALGLPALNGLIFHFNALEVWQQLGFYFASFALLVLASVGCLIAIC